MQIDVERSDRQQIGKHYNVLGCRHAPSAAPFLALLPLQIVDRCLCRANAKHFTPAVDAVWRGVLRVPPKRLPCILRAGPLSNTHPRHHFLLLLVQIDVERSELDVLDGVRPEHWPLIRQVRNKCTHCLATRPQSVATDNGSEHLLPIGQILGAAAHLAPGL